jgi:hypothetical protein
MVGLKEYLNRRKQSKLYKQWVQQSQLPVDEIPPELRSNQDRTSGKPSTLEVSDIDTPYSPKPGMVSLPIKYLLFMMLLITALLVALSVVMTLLLAGP